jgi:hypothetical protein
MLTSIILNSITHILYCLVTGRVEETHVSDDCFTGGEPDVEKSGLSASSHRNASTTRSERLLRRHSVSVLNSKSRYIV